MREVGIIDRGRLPAPDFQSSEQTVTLDTLLNVAHGFGARPALWTVYLRCTSTANNYTVGDELLTFRNAAAVDAGVTYFSDTTNISVVQGSTIFIHDKTSFDNAAITVGNYRWIVRAWR